MLRARSVLVVTVVIAACAAIAGALAWIALRDDPTRESASAPARVPAPVAPAVTPALPVAEPAGSASRSAGPTPANAAATVATAVAPGDETKPPARAVRVPPPPPRRSLAETVGRARELRRTARDTIDPTERKAHEDAAAALEREVGPHIGPLARGELRDAEAAFALLADAALADRFRPDPETVVLDGSRWVKGDPLPAHVVLRFPAGMHAFQPEDVATANPAPKSVVVEGAGIDATVLVEWSRWDARRDGPRWTFRDVTVDCGSDEFLHGGTAELRLERVRVVGCDSGAGGSEAFDQDGLLVALDCRFESGFGHSPGHVNLFEGSRLSVRLDRCVFVGPFSDFSDDTTTVATDCTFESAPKDFAQFVAIRSGDLADVPAQKGARTWFIDCRVVSEVGDLRWPSRVLTDLNPAWTKKGR